MRIPLYKPHITRPDIAAVLAVLRSGWISHRGPAVGKFEKAFARAAGARYAVAVSSGTAALHCALVGMAVGRTVTVPGLTYVATVNAVRHNGGEPRFVDVDPNTWTTHADVGVALYGYPAAGGSVTDMAEAHGLPQLGPACAWSFFANKTITTGEGGMVTTDHEVVARIAYELSHQGTPMYGVPGRDYEYYRTERLGWNYRMTAMQAALGLSQLRRLKSVVARKRAIARWYRRELDKSLPVYFQADHPNHTHWLVSARVKDRDGLREHLAAAGIETRPVFPAMGDTPVAHRIAAEGISFPSWPGLRRADVRRVADAVRRFYR